MYLAIVVMLANAIWAGSWSRLWHELLDTLKSVGSLAALNVMMAALAFWYLKLPRAFRALTLVLSLTLSVLAVIGATSVSLHRHTIEAPVPVWTLMVAKSLLAVGYCSFSYSLWKVGGVASNNRWRGP